MSQIATTTDEKRSPLLPSHLEMGANLNTYFEWQMPVSYQDIEKEVWNVRNGVGIIDLSYHGVLKIGGKEGAQFLQGLVSNDVKTLHAGQGMRAAFLTGHGKVKAFCVILSLGEEYLVINDPQTHEKVHQYIFPFSYAGDFQVEEVSDVNRIISLQGPDSLLVLREVCFEPIPELLENGWVSTIIAGQRVIVLRHTHTGELGYDLLIPESSLKDVWEFLLLKGRFHSITPFGMEGLEILRIEAGIPVYGIDIDESNMILESGLEDAVSFSKGCYTGQEAVAMATYRGHVSKKLSGLIFDDDTDVKRQDKIIKMGKEIGFISSIIQSLTLKKKVGLGCIKYGYYTPGEKVEVVTLNKTVEATIVQLPFTE